jgi:hypothetical protein
VIPFIIMSIEVLVAGRLGFRFPVGARGPLEKPTPGWVDNIIMDLGEIGWDGRDWIKLDQDRDQWRALVNTVTNLRVL